MFSVVIPLYNKAHTIVDTIESVLAQDCQDFELLIVDDGSTDGSRELVQEFNTDSRLRIVTQKHRGVSAARNAGIAVARNELIVLLDADDILLPEYLKTMKGVIEEFPDAGMYCCAGFIRYPDGSGYLRTSPRFNGRAAEVKYFQNPSFFGNCSSTILRKSPFQLLGGFPDGMSHQEDMVLFFKLALKAPVIFCPTPLSIYQKGVPGQASENDTYRAVITRSNLVYAFWSKLRPVEQDPLFVDLIRNEFRQILFLYLKNKQYDSISEFFELTDPALLSHLGTVERALDASPSLRRLALLRTQIAKVRYRLRFHPRPKYRSQLSIVPMSSRIRSADSENR